MAAERPTPSGNGPREFGIVLPTLLPPSEGAFEQTYADYLNDPERFTVALQYRIRNDNPELLTFFRSSSISENPNLARKWLVVYYGMFETSARNAGLPPLQVSSRIIERYMRLGLLTSVNGFETETEGETMRRIKEDWEKRRERDRAFSPELAKFWQSVEQDMARARDEDDDYDVDSVGDILPVVSVQTLLQMQQDEFSLIERYEL